jgi:penicillin-binding protein 1C
MKPGRKALAFAALGVLLPCLALVISAVFEPLPVGLGEQSSTRSLEILDRNGRLLRVVRTREGELAAPVRLKDVSSFVVPALLAAEDARFYSHPGVDPLAIGRALGQAVLARKVVSGASTLTQQLARTVVARPRTVAGKWREMAIALRIEHELDKELILEEYLSRVEFGPNVRGIEAASSYYFDKPARELSLAEAAALVSLPRGPSLYDPRRGSDRLLRRRDRVIERLRGLKLVPPAAIDRALATPLVLSRAQATGGVEHFASALVQGKLAGDTSGRSKIRTTLDADLQREVETLARRAVAELTAERATALSVLVVDNATGEVLSYLGSPEFLSPLGGQNDGTRALRQPGSTLKPFVYAAAIAELGMTGATLLPDLELYRAEAGGGVYAPKNYDRRFHGPVRLREALASSLNVPAVWTAEKVGVDRVLGLLRRLGFESLREDAEHYGPALALGDGEVRLSELVNAYATLARGGEFRPLVYQLGDGAAGEPRRVLDEKTAALVTSMLSDRTARAASFGLGGVLELPFETAVKTGTSKGLRDNWTLGFTRELTVGVWVGNFDGTPLVRSSGVTGAGPLFREVMLAAMRHAAGSPEGDGRATSALGGDGLVDVEVCALSGKLPHADCAHRIQEPFVPGTEPRERCDMHERVRVEPESGLRAGPACRRAEERVFERYPAEFATWAAESGRPTAPRAYAPACPGPALDEASAPEIVFPTEGARFVLDPLAPERQEVVFEARGVASSAEVEFVLDGRSLGKRAVPHRKPWPLALGEHTLVVRAGARESRRVRFEVRRERRAAPELLSTGRSR